MTRALTQGVARPVRLAFAGRMASGKTSLASLFAMRYPPMARIAYSHAIKRAAKLAWGVQKPDRQLCQRLGALASHTLPHLWDQMISKDLERMGTREYVIDGLRYRANFEWWGKRATRIVYIEVSRATQLERITKRGTLSADLPRLEHESESCVSSSKHMADWVLNSDGLGVPCEFVDATLDWFGVPLHCRKPWDMQAAKRLYGQTG